MAKGSIGQPRGDVHADPWRVTADRRRAPRGSVTIQVWMAPRSPRRDAESPESAAGEVTGRSLL
jgi:hypothetical protein